MDCVDQNVSPEEESDADDCSSGQTMSSDNRPPHSEDANPGNVQLILYRFFIFNRSCFLILGRSNYYIRVLVLDFYTEDDCRNSNHFLLPSMIF